MNQTETWVCTLTEDARRRFASGEARGRERRDVLEHLLAGCESCRSALSASPAATRRDEEQPSRLSNLLASINQRAAEIERERAEADRLMEGFATHPVNRQWTLIRNSARFDSWQFASRLLDLAFEAIYDDARRSLELASMARTIADRLDEERYGARLVADLVARALAHVGNAQRAVDALSDSAASLAEAREMLAAGTGDPLLEAELLYYEASLARACRRIPEALAKVLRSRAIYRELGDRHLEGRSLLGLGTIRLVQGEFELALAAYRGSLELIDEDRDPRLAHAARHNIVRTLAEAGRVEEATEALAGFRSDYERLDDATALAKLEWLEARLFMERRADAEAERAFRSARERLAQLELPYPVAMTSLELATILFHQGRFAELRQLAAETLVTFRALGIEREAIAAWLVLERALEAQSLTAALLGRLSSYFAEAERRPGLEFEPGLS